MRKVGVVVVVVVGAGVVSVVSVVSVVRAATVVLRQREEGALPVAAAALALAVEQFGRSAAPPNSTAVVGRSPF